MGQLIDIDDLLDATGVAELLGLSQRSSVATYRARHANFPEPAIDMGAGRCLLWRRQDIEAWLAGYRAGTAGDPSPATSGSQHGNTRSRLARRTRRTSARRAHPRTRRHRTSQGTEAMTGSQDPNAAAWVPWDSTTPWADAAELAADWADHQADQLGATVLVVKATHDVSLSGTELAGYEYTTPKSRRQPGRAVVIAWVPDVAALDLAILLARGHALCVVESSLHPVKGWARAARAVNLLDGSQQAPIDDVLVERLRSIEMYSSNGFTGEDGVVARRKLQEMRNDGILDRDAVLGHFASRVHARGMKRLEKLLNDLA